MNAQTQTEIAQAVVTAMWAWYESRPLFAKYPMPTVDAKTGRLRRARTPEEIIHRHITRMQVFGGTR